MKKQWTCLLAAALCLGTTACGGLSAGGASGNKTVLKVHTLDGGVGQTWLKDLEAQFEAAYAEHEFETGKKGVDVVVAADATRYTATTIKNSTTHVFFLENGSSADLSASGAALDITDVVTGLYTGETATIESKMSDKQKAALTYNDKYYVLPHYETAGGIAYDIDVFNSKKLYMAEGGGYTNLAGSRTAGPDGVKDTEDDGLPTTYEEFYALCDRMVAQNVTPFICCGDTSYPNLLLQGLFTNYCGADEALLNVEFNSGDGTTEIVTGFDADGNPVIENVQITESNAALLSQQAGKYYALEFLANVVAHDGSKGTKAWYDTLGFASTTTHTAAQEEFLLGYIEKNDYGMLIDGSYWYNEAKKSGAVARASAAYGSDVVESRRFGWMSLPSEVSGTAEAHTQVFADLAYSYCVVNGNLANNKAMADVAKLFVQFCYTEENLKAFTATTGVTRGLNYKITDEQLNSLDYFNKYIVTLRQKSNCISPISANAIYQKNQSAFSWNIGLHFWQTTAGGGAFLPLTKFRGSSKLTAREYFEGMEVSQSTWDKNYLG